VVRHGSVSFSLVALVMTLVFGSLLYGCANDSQSTPETVVRAYVRTIVAGDCERAARYWSPDVRDDFVKRACAGDPVIRLDDARIDAVEVTPRNGKYMVTLVGKFTIDFGYGLKETRFEESFVTEQLNGECFIVSGI
jgi:hypothetical protein